MFIVAVTKLKTFVEKMAEKCKLDMEKICRDKRIVR